MQGYSHKEIHVLWPRRGYASANEASSEGLFCGVVEASNLYLHDSAQGFGFLSTPGVNSVI